MILRASFCRSRIERRTFLAKSSLLVTAMRPTVIAMNRFKVIKEERKAFEGLWVARRSHLDEVKGFRAFHLRGSEREDHVLYSSHTIWASQEDFTAWTKSEQFRAAHRHAGASAMARFGDSSPRRRSPLKKIVCAAEQDRPDVAAERMRWQEDQKQLDPKRLVFIDETWAKM